MARTAILALFASFVVIVAPLHGSQGASLASSPPKAEQIAFVRLWAVCKPTQSYCADLYLMHADGTDQRRLVRRVPDGTPDFSWSPDGQKIAFTGRRPGIWVINVNGTGLHALTRNPADSDPAWSPDGRLIAFGRYDANFTNEDIYVMNTDGSQQRLLARGGGLDKQSGFTWSPDGRTIAYIVQVGTDQTGNDAKFSRIYLVGSRGGRSRLLERREFSITIDGLTWSPDGRRIAYADRSELLSESEICIKSLQGGQARCPRSMRADNEGDIYDPAWSPDGRKIAFDGIYVASPDGKRIRHVGGNTGGEDPSWSPDGRKIAFDFNGIYVVNADRTGLRRLTRNDGVHGHPDDRWPLWQPPPGKR